MLSLASCIKECWNWINIEEAARGTNVQDLWNNHTGWVMVSPQIAPILFLYFHTTDPSVQFSPFTYWVTAWTWGTIQQRFSSSLFCRRQSLAVLAWAGMATLWIYVVQLAFPLSNQAMPTLQGALKDGFGEAFMPGPPLVSVSWQLPVEVPVGPWRSWSCSTSRPFFFIFFNAY